MAKIRLKKFLSKSDRVNFHGKGAKNPAAALAARVKSGKKPDKSRRKKRFTLRTSDSPPWPELEEQFLEAAKGPRTSEWWDLFRDGINNSGLALWLTCRHQFWLRYVCGYDRPAYAEPIEFGNVFHWLIERWHEKPGSLKPKKVFGLLVEDYHTEWMKTAPLLSPKDKQAQQSFYGLAAAMWPFYADRYAADLTYKRRRVEQEFRVDHELKDGTKIPLFGTIDLQWVTDGGFDIIDHKTSSFINEQEKQQALSLDLQLLFYGWARFLQTGKAVHTIWHDVIRRTHLKMTSKETPQQYGKRIAAKVAEDPAHFFIRFPVTVRARKLKLYAQTVIKPMIEDLAAWARGDAPHYINPNALVGRYGPCRLFGNITQGNFSGLPRRRPTTRGVEI